jgi:predicted phosphodiesterase
MSCPGFLTIRHPAGGRLSLCAVLLGAMGMIALISDIHGNLEALQTVLAEIDRRGVDEIICLGDVVGYGPNPTECIDLVMRRCSVTLMGNHDFAVFYEPYNFNVGAEQACYWTRAQFEADANAERRDARWRFLGKLQPLERRPGVMCAHASPRRPINEYIFPDDIYTNSSKFGPIFERVEKVCFVGHTHVPGVFLEGPDFYSPEELDARFELGIEKAVINVGSVGQPRDRDPRSSFVLFDGRSVEFVRVAYDVDAVVKKVEKIDALDNFLGSRLRDGK